MPVENQASTKKARRETHRLLRRSLARNPITWLPAVFTVLGAVLVILYLTNDVEEVFGIPSVGNGFIMLIGGLAGFVYAYISNYRHFLPMMQHIHRDNDQAE